MTDRNMSLALDSQNMRQRESAYLWPHHFTRIRTKRAVKSDRMATFSVWVDANHWTCVAQWAAFSANSHVDIFPFKVFLSFYIRPISSRVLRRCNCTGCGNRSTCSGTQTQMREREREGGRGLLTAVPLKIKGRWPNREYNHQSGRYERKAAKDEAFKVKSVGRPWKFQTGCNWCYLIHSLIHLFTCCKNVSVKERDAWFSFIQLRTLSRDDVRSREIRWTGPQLSSIVRHWNCRCA